MEKTSLRRFNFALLQDHQARGDRTPVKTELHVHFHSDLDRVADENLFARQGADYRSGIFLSRAAHREYPVVVRRADLWGYVCQCHLTHDLRQQTVLRRNLRVRDAPFALAHLRGANFKPIVLRMAEMRTLTSYVSRFLLILIFFSGVWLGDAVTQPVRV